MSLSRAGVRVFRLAAVLLAVWLVRDAHESASPSARPLSIAEARTLFPETVRFGKFHRALGAQTALDAEGAPLGLVLRTSPQSDDLIGYAGPSDLVVGLSLDGRIERVRLSSSSDTRAHVDAVRSDESFWFSFEGRESSRPLAVDAVSGSTLTSLAMAEGVERRLSGRVRSLRFTNALELGEVDAMFPGAAEIVLEEDGWNRVLDANGGLLGHAVRSSPQADNVVGYAGPTEVLIGVSRDRARVTGVRLRESYDSAAYVDRVRGNRSFLDSLVDRSVDDWIDIDFVAEKIEGTSGATQTSYAVAEGIRRRLAADVEEVEQRSNRGLLRNVALALIVIGALLLTFGPWRRNRKLRRAWQVVLIGGFGLALGDLLSVALVAGWSSHGVPLDSAPALVLLVAVALVVPWSTRKQIYCHSLCPHGAAQEWISSFRGMRRSLSARALRTLGHVPSVSLAGVFLVALFLPGFDLANVEAFDAWTLGIASAVSFALLALGLVACLFVPMAYCRFGCPTGALLEFVRAHGTTERFRARDAVAVFLLVIGGASAWQGPDSADPALPQVAREEHAAIGHAFGTTWSLKLRDSALMTDELRLALDSELERLESQLSSWRPGSEVSQFNSAATKFEIEVSDELLTLAEHAHELSEATAGAFDITVGPLVDAWGAGPSGALEASPTDDEIAALLECTSYEKLEVRRHTRSLRKSRCEELQLDLGALLQGHAADRLATILDEHAIAEYLIDVGGELLAHGAWTVAIEDPRDPSRVLTTFTLRDAALATSGSYRMRHIVSPKSGRPVEARWILCAVIASDALTADGWATALLASSTEALMIAAREGVCVLVVDANGRVVRSDPAAFR